MTRHELIEGIWERDPTVWTGHDEARWLGWLDEPLRMQEQLDEARSFAESVRASADDVVLLGMGGSSLAPEVLRQTFHADRFHVLDTTHPRAIRALEERIDPTRTLFVAASKSGTTLETRSHTAYFLAKGGRFATITDPGSDLEGFAQQNGFLHVFHGEPSIGGRYSALSPFGMVPAVLMGADAGRLLEGAAEMREACRLRDGNPGYELGSGFGEGWREGRDKLCIASTGAAPSFGLWAEQLVAESTGKQGKGLVPAPGQPADGPDRQAAEAQIPEPEALGVEFFRWEFAVAVAGAYLEINPFDQPDVQAAKDKTNEVLATGEEPALEPQGSIDELLAQAREGDYFCIQAFVAPGPETDAKLERLVADVGARSGLVVTHGYGPRYLHSTGQLHKGGPNTGLFLQLVDDPGEELPIPGKPFGFRRLIRAQAAGDFESLVERGRRVARVRLEDL